MTFLPKIAAVMLTSVIAIASASAADLYHGSQGGGYKDGYVPFSWTGFYVGAQLGGAWSSGNVSDASLPILNAAPVASSFNMSGISGGAVAGYMFQVSPTFVLGAEADFTAFSESSTATAPNLFGNGLPVGSGGVAWKTEADWLSTVRGRVGYLVNPDLMIFASGGFAFGEVQLKGQHAYAGGCPNCIFGSQTDTSTGYAVGGGIEYHIGGNWLLRGEYLFANLEGKSLTSVVNFPSATFNWSSIDVQTARAALTYKFGSLYQPLK